MSHPTPQPRHLAGTGEETQPSISSPISRASASPSHTPRTFTRSAEFVVGEQRLAQTPAIVGDQVRGGGEDVAGGAVIALKPYNLRAGKIVLEAEDVIDLGAAPAVDRLIVVADHAQILARLRQQAQPQILRDVGVLILVHHQVAELLVIALQHVGVVLEHVDHVQQQVAEIAGVKDFQPRLIGRVELDAGAIGEGIRFALRHFVRGQRAVLPAIDQPGELAAGELFLVDILGFDDLLQQPDLIVGVENGETGLEPDQFRVRAQHARADGMEGAQKRQAAAAGAEQRFHSLAHFARRLVGEGDRQHAPRLGASSGQEMRQPRGQHTGFAGARARQHQQRPVQRLHRRALLGVERGRGRALAPWRAGRWGDGLLTSSVVVDGDENHRKRSCAVENNRAHPVTYRTSCWPQKESHVVQERKSVSAEKVEVVRRALKDTDSVALDLDVRCVSHQFPQFSFDCCTQELVRRAMALSTVGENLGHGMLINFRPECPHASSPQRLG